MEHEKDSENKGSINKNKFGAWQASTIVLGIVSIILFIMLFAGKTAGSVISEGSAGKMLTTFLNQQTEGGVGLVSIADKGHLYEVTVSYQGKEIPVYITKDGKYFVQGAVDITATPSNNDSPNNNNSQEPAKEIPKSDKPKAELFVMTHCPYGTQAEKGLIPAIEALGNKTDIKIRFVHYFMHGDKEEKETYNQVCIREEQPSKYLDYLSCFLEDGDGERCLTQIGIDKTKLSNCVANNAKAYYKTDSELSQKYGVQGSPTLVINGAQADSGRDSASFLRTICSSFNASPEECAQQLSSDSPSPGFGYSKTAGTASPASAGGGCASA